MRVAILAAIAINCAGAAFAQDDACRNGQPDRAKQEFVVPFTAASRALQASDWSGAMRNAALARPHAMSGQQSSAVTQIEIAALTETGEPGTLAAAIEAAMATPCLPVVIREHYAAKLRELRTAGTATQQQ